MKCFSEEVSHTSTNSTLNILQVEDFEEIFFDVFEIELNNKKYPVEKISEYKGNPVVNLPIVVEGKEVLYPFVLSKGKPEILFNENNTELPFDDDPVVFDYIEDEELISESKQEILQEIENAKNRATKAIEKSKLQKLSQISEDTKKKNRVLKNTLEKARETLVEEFISISDKIKNELVVESSTNFSDLKETLNNKLVDISDSLESQLKEDFENASTIFDKSVKKLVKELYSETVSPKLDKELQDIAVQVFEKVEEIGKNVSKKLEDKADITLVEGVSKEIVNIQKANIELNDTINKGINKSLSRSGNVKTLVEKLEKEVDVKVADAVKNIENYFDDKLKFVREEAIDLSEESRHYIVNLVNESKENLLEEIRKLPKEKPVEYIIESKKNPERVNVDALKNEYDKVIHDKFENYKTDLRRYIAVYSGGGSVATQFADGGTMNGDLIVNADIISNAFVTNNGLSSQFVKGDGTLDNTQYLKPEDLTASVTLYPTTASSDIGGYNRLISDISDPDYDVVAVDVPTGEISGENQLLASLVADPGLIQGNPGIVNLTIIGNIRKTGGATSKNASFHFHAYKRNLAGDEYEIGVSSNTLEVDSDIYTEYDASLLFNDGEWTPTDRLVLKFYGTLMGGGGGSLPTYDFMFGGDTPVRVLLPLPVSVLLSQYVPYTDASHDVDLGAHSLSAANLTASGTVTTNGLTVNDPNTSDTILTVDTNSASMLLGFEGYENFQANGDIGQVILGPVNYDGDSLILGANSITFFDDLGQQLKRITHDEIQGDTTFTDDVEVLGNVEAASYTLNGVAQQDVSTGADVSFARVALSNIVTSGSYWVTIPAIKDVQNLWALKASGVLGGSNGTNGLALAANSHLGVTGVDNNAITSLVLRFARDTNDAWKITNGNLTDYRDLNLRNLTASGTVEAASYTLSGGALSITADPDYGFPIFSTTSLDDYIQFDNDIRLNEYKKITVGLDLGKLWGGNYDVAALTNNAGDGMHLDINGNAEFDGDVIIQSALNPSDPPLNIKNAYGTSGYTVAHVTTPFECMLVTGMLNSNFAMKTLANGEDEGFRFLNSTNTDIFSIYKSGGATLLGKLTAANLTASGTVEAASYTRGGVAQQDVSTGADVSFASVVVGSAGRGIWYDAGNRMYFGVQPGVTGGGLAYNTGNKKLSVVNGSVIGFDNADSNRTVNTSISRISSGLLGIGSGSAGDSTGSLQLANLTASGTVTGNKFVDGLESASPTTDYTLSGKGRESLTLGVSTVVTMPDPATHASILVFVIQSADGGYEIDFTGVIWKDGTAPTQTATPDKTDIYSFVSDGANWYGSVTQNF